MGVKYDFTHSAQFQHFRILVSKTTILPQWRVEAFLLNFVQINITLYYILHDHDF